MLRDPYPTSSFFFFRTLFDWLPINKAYYLSKKKKKKAYQIEILTVCWKSQMDVQCLKPQTQGQSTKVRISKDGRSV